MCLADSTILLHVSGLTLTAHVYLYAKEEAKNSFVLTCKQNNKPAAIQSN